MIELDQLADQAVGATPSRVPAMAEIRERARQRYQRRRVMPAAVVVAALVTAGGVAGWGALGDRDDTQTVAAGGPETSRSVPIEGPGQFVWPSPARDITTLEELVDVFGDEVLGWAPDEVRQDGGDTGTAEPQSFTLVNLDSGVEIQALANPSSQGWGFIQIGGPMTLGETGDGGFALHSDRPAGTTWSVAEIRHRDATVAVETDTTTYPLPDDLDPRDVITALVIHQDEQGMVLGVSGAKFSEPAEQVAGPNETTGTVTVADLVGLLAPEAIQALEQTGLQVNVAVSSAPVPGVGPNTVTGIDPQPGSIVDAGTTVTIVVTPGPAQALCGPSLPLSIEVVGAAGQNSSTSELTPNIAGQLAERIEHGSLTIETRWPATERMLYDLDGNTHPGGELDTASTMTGTHDISVATNNGERLPVLRITNEAPDTFSEQCHIIEFTIYAQGQPVARFGWDVTTTGADFPDVDLGPYITESRQVSSAPETVVSCNGPDDLGPPNTNGTAQTSAHASAAEALAAFLATPAAEAFYQSGYIEMITTDRTHTYGAPFDNDNTDNNDTQYVTLITIEPTTNGWTVTNYTASGC